MNLELSLFQTLSIVLMLSSIVTAFKNLKLSFILLGLTIITSTFIEAITPIGLVALFTLAALSYITHKMHHKFIKLTSSFLVIIICLLLAAHLLPGFNNIQLLGKVEKSTISIPFTLYFNFDKPFIFFALVLLNLSILRNHPPVLLNSNYQLLNKSYTYLVIIPLVYTLAYNFSLIAFDFTVPNWWWIFAINNLIMTCIVEEVFFRAFLQRKLQQRFKPIWAVIITSALFGIAHFAGGASYVLVATLAGLVYGLVYLVSGKLWQAIIAHFIVNFLHLSFFTYPLAK